MRKLIITKLEGLEASILEENDNCFYTVEKSGETIFKENVAVVGEDDFEIPEEIKDILVKTTDFNPEVIVRIIKKMEEGEVKVLKFEEYFAAQLALIARKRIKAKQENNEVVNDIDISIGLAEGNLQFLCFTLNGKMFSIPANDEEEIDKIAKITDTLIEIKGVLGELKGKTFEEKKEILSRGGK